ncbi:MAG: glycoside hydrolase family 9 protein [Lachnospiraceae bacterium]|nr:glycoside hydrolase family 9 protein [Lachnospiraceae bacterium]
MRKMKKAAAYVMAAAMMFSMIGCGKKNEEATSATTATGSDAQTTQAAVIEDDGDWVTTEAALPDTRRFTIEEGSDAIGINFDDNDLHGFTTFAEGGVFDIEAKGGACEVNISGIGTAEHGCQVYFDGFAMANGCKYRMCFDITSSVERMFEWRIQLNGGDYHAYASDRVNIGPETVSVDYEFTMEETSDPAPRLAFNLGKYEGFEDIGAHTVTIDNVSLFVVDGSNAEVIKGCPVPIQVKVNQIGYKPDDVKSVLVTSPDDEKFKVVNVSTNETVYIGTYSAAAFDPAMGTSVRIGDFSEVTAPGTYQIISSPSGASYEFDIGDGLYDDIYKDVVLMLYNQRCGTKLEASVSGDFAHDACHTQEATVYGDTSGKTYDVSGGWHDAGDYGRYVVPGAKTVEDLFLAYEDFDYTADDIGIPESGNGVPDLLDEARYELEWMLKMQDEATGGVYHKVTGLTFPGMVLATEETEDMVLAPISYAATADFVAVMAKASVNYAQYDQAFADTCLAAAKKGYDFMKANPDMGGFKNPDEILTGEYPDVGLTDETFWAAAELYLATLDDGYLADTKEAIDTKYNTGLGWAGIGGYALYDLAKAEGIDSGLQSNAKEKFLAVAHKKLSSCQTSHIFIGIETYPWGSNMVVAGDGMYLLMASKLEDDPAYLEYAQKQRDYIFGFNGTGYCYVTGYGDLSPQDTHHRPSQALGKTMPGMLVGGADENLEDPYASAVLYGKPGALAYVDNSQSFSCNEITIYWNSPLIYLMTGLQ